MPLQQLDVAEQVRSLSILARQDAPVPVRNNLPGIVTFTDDINTHIPMMWEGRGDPKGGDVREVPPPMLLNPQFRENVLRGILSIEPDTSALENALRLQRADWDQRQLTAANASAEIQKANDTVVAHGVSCIAPKSARELCGTYAVVMGKNPDEAPPLCAEHMHLAVNYESQTTGRLVNGKDEVIWKRKSAVSA